MNIVDWACETGRCDDPTGAYKAIENERDFDSIANNKLAILDLKKKMLEICEDIAYLERRCAKRKNSIELVREEILQCNREALTDAINLTCSGDLERELAKMNHDQLLAFSDKISRSTLDEQTKHAHEMMLRDLDKKKRSPGDVAHLELMLKKILGYDDG